MHDALKTVLPVLEVIRCNADGWPVTEWLDGSQQPEYVGVYERDYSELPSEDVPGAAYCFFDGGTWYIFGETPEEAQETADNHRGLTSNHQKLPWRGLREHVPGVSIQYSRAGTAA